MLFGKRIVEEQIGPENLLTELNASFNSKLADFSLRSKRVVESISAISSKFIEECDRFEEFSGKPENDNEYMSSRIDSHVLESQKRSYTRALKSIMSPKHDIRAENEYEFYARFLEDIKARKERVLKTNNMFRAVFVSYPRHLNRFKDVFSGIDKSISRLEYEMGRVDPEYERYKALAGMISKFGDELRELEYISSDIKEIGKGQVDRETQTAPNKAVDSRMEETRKEISDIDNNILKETQEINAAFLHLERPARKYDYVVGKRGKLLDSILDPVGGISDASRYRALERELISLREAIDKGEVQIKNAEETMTHISYILGSDMLGRINRIRELRSESAKLTGELAGMSRVVKEQREKEDTRRRKRESLSELNSDLDKCRSRISGLKESIEEGFLKYYGRKITIK